MLAICPQDIPPFAHPSCWQWTHFGCHVGQRREQAAWGGSCPCVSENDSSVAFLRKVIWNDLIVTIVWIASGVGLKAITKLKRLQPPQHIISVKVLGSDPIPFLTLPNPSVLLQPKIFLLVFSQLSHFCLPCLQLERALQLPPLLLCQPLFSLLPGTTHSSMCLSSAQSCSTHPLPLLHILALEEEFSALLWGAGKRSKHFLKKSLGRNLLHPLWQPEKKYKNFSILLATNIQNVLKLSKIKTCKHSLQWRTAVLRSCQHFVFPWNTSQRRTLSPTWTFIHRNYPLAILFCSLP